MNEDRDTLPDLVLECEDDDPTLRMVRPIPNGAGVLFSIIVGFFLWTAVIWMVFK